ncbi:flagellar basal body P-ring formation chaperone FlgA [Candidatus Pantoea multigeneris]|uniref:Flagella basal body P-ring formation protein FlgA n=1 Tax=Candidatus Pantoea multigeneris TaxID=2608357 RepID=A0ABX0R530_9GAMM|nr:flagellar basal body P-ring formation chaperone FlgA [Pantoea multigeneris]NIF20511.1 flagellar basal body P-ring formation protein FlgA [Pantoea multigeneris]
MRFHLSLLSGLLVGTVLSAQAADLPAQLTQFFKARDPQHAAGMVVQVRTPDEQWPTCATPQLMLPGNSRLWGNMSVAASCGENRRFLQVQVQVSGGYLVAQHQLRRGVQVSARDFRLQQGRLDTLPPRTLFSVDKVADAVVLRDIEPGQPVTQTMLRQPWRVKAGESVTVVASGNGFSATAAGKAMSNGAASDWVRVRMDNGQVVNGRVDERGNILITL